MVNAGPIELVLCISNAPGSGSACPPGVTCIPTGGGGSGGGGGGGGCSGSSNASDQRIRDFARLLHKTGVQSLGNPCTVAFFYGSSIWTAVDKGKSLGALLMVKSVADQVGLLDQQEKWVKEKIQAGCNQLQP